MNNKSVHKKRDRSTNSQKQYVRGIVHNLSLQRWTDQEIADYLRTEKKIDLARITINGIRRNIEKQAAKWYTELRESRYKYIAVYKERLDSLMSYQRKLNQIVEFYLDPPIIEAIAELHRIEISIFSLWKQLPDLEVVDEHKPLYQGPNDKDLEVSPYINIYNIKPEYRSQIRPVGLCRCTPEIKGHFACNKCMRGFCRPVESRVDGIVKCPDCNSVVYEPADPTWS